MPWLPANGDCTRRQVPHPWNSTFSAAVDSSAPHYGAWYRVSGKERVAVGCAAQTRYARTRTYFEVAPRSRCGDARYRVSGTERVAVGCARRRATHGRRTY